MKCNVKYSVKNTKTTNYKKVVESINKDIDDFYSSIIEAIPIDINFFLIFETCKNDKELIDVYFATCACSLIDKNIDIGLTTKTINKEMGMNVKELTVELTIFTLFMIKLHSMFNDFMEKMSKDADGFSETLEKYENRAKRLYYLTSTIEEELR